MGLDQYAYASTEIKSEDREELSYWRKHNRLQGWMEALWEDKGRPHFDNLTNPLGSPQASMGDRLADLYSHVCLEIRKGNFDPDTKNHKELRNILDEAALQLVMEYNPKYLGENRNK